MKFIGLIAAVACFTAATSALPVREASDMPVTESSLHALESPRGRAPTSLHAKFSSDDNISASIRAQNNIETQGKSRKRPEGPDYTPFYITSPTGKETYFTNSDITTEWYNGINGPFTINLVRGQDAEDMQATNVYLKAFGADASYTWHVPANFPPGTYAFRYIYKNRGVQYETYTEQFKILRSKRPAKGKAPVNTGKDTSVETTSPDATDDSTGVADSETYPEYDSSYYYDANALGSLEDTGANVGESYEPAYQTAGGVYADANAGVDNTVDTYADDTTGAYTDDTAGLYADNTAGLYADNTSGLYADNTAGVYADNAVDPNGDNTVDTYVDGTGSLYADGTVVTDNTGSAYADVNTLGYNDNIGSAYMDGNSLYADLNTSGYTDSTGYVSADGTTVDGTASVDTTNVAPEDPDMLTADMSSENIDSSASVDASENAQAASEVTESLAASEAEADESENRAQTADQGQASTEEGADVAAADAEAA